MKGVNIFQIKYFKYQIQMGIKRMIESYTSNFNKFKLAASETFEESLININTNTNTKNTLMINLKNKLENVYTMLTTTFKRKKEKMKKHKTSKRRKATRNSQKSNLKKK